MQKGILPVFFEKSKVFRQLIEIISDVDHFNSLVEVILKQLFSAGPGCGDGEKAGSLLAIASVFAFLCRRRIV